MIKKYILFLIFILSYASMHMHAQQPGASFLKIAPGSRAAGMGGAYTSLAFDASAVWWNPGGLAQLKTNELTGTHAEWLADTNYDFLSFARPSSRGTLAGGISMLSMGSIESRDENRNKTSDFTAQDTAISLAYGCTIAQKFSQGIHVKYIQQSIGDVHAKGYAVDYGGILPLPVSGFRLGYGVYNLGPKMKFISESYHLPLRYSLGVSFQQGALTVGLDTHYEYYESKTNVSFGSEYALFTVMSLRCGYLYNTLQSLSNNAVSSNEHINSAGIRGGFGIAVFGYQMDYALVPYGELGSTHRISFASKF
ncbi:MAG: PorV/PorQ family protein [bacterium]